MIWPLAVLAGAGALGSAVAHGDAGVNKPAAAVAGSSKPGHPGSGSNGHHIPSYIQKHMASEHHIQAFDLGSFFALHDLNRDGVWDRPEIEAIYGVHHSMSIKHSPNAEVHDAKADHIVKEVFSRLDTNHDAMISKTEFLHAGMEGLPSFEEYGKDILGHHYDSESEFFVHHEQEHHNSPDTQTDKAYTHPEDEEHFRNHQKIEQEEEDRDRKAQGMPSRHEESRLRAESKAKGQKFVSPYEKSRESRPEDKVFHEVDHDAYYEGYAQEQAASQQHIFRGPGGQHIVKSPTQNTGHEEQAMVQEEGETEQGYQQRKRLYQQRVQAAAYFDDLDKQQKARVAQAAARVHREPGESQERFQRRIDMAKSQAARQAGAKAPSGSTQGNKAAGRMRNGPPKKVCLEQFRSYH